MPPPMCFRNKYITPNINPYSICLDCKDKVACTTAILDEPGFEYVDPAKPKILDPREETTKIVAIACCDCGKQLSILVNESAMIVMVRCPECQERQIKTLNNKDKIARECSEERRTCKL
jgi:hypothetical protein